MRKYGSRAMTGFFDPPPEPSRPRRPLTPAPEWSGPPEGALPGVVAVELVLARNERAAVYVGRCAAYPAGFEFEVRVIAAAAGLDPSLNGAYARRSGDGNNYSEMLRFGIEFSDGAHATNVRYQTPADGPPAPPYLRGMGGSGSTTSWSQGFWVWPLPPPGPLTFVCEWPAADISQTRTEIDAQTVIDAGARASVVFPGQPEPEESWTSSSIAIHSTDHPSGGPPGRNAT
jgi:hypothetical protein